MIQYIRHKNINFPKWDDCIDKAHNGNIYAYSWYLDNACEQWDALIKGDYEMIMPLPYRKKFGLHYVFPPSMTQQLGIFSQQLMDENLVMEFIHHIPSKFKYCEINLNHFNLIQPESFPVSTHINLELLLNQPYSDLFKRFSENTKRNIKKASQSEIQIRKDGKIQDLIQLFIESKAPEIKKLPNDYYEVIERLATFLLQWNQAEIWEAWIGNELCAGIMFAFSQNRAYFLFSVANLKAKENGMMPFLINTFIEENAGKNMVLDFEGSDNKNLARFYKSFGATEKNYQKIVLNRLPAILISLDKMIKKK